MSLTDRVNKASASDPGSMTATSGTLTLETLKEDACRWISFDEIANLMAKNPQRARNELRTASKRALSETRWDGVSTVEKQRLTNELIDIVFGMGHIEALLNDEAITEIMVNGCRSLFYEKNGILYQSDLKFENDSQVRVLIDRIIGPLGRRIDESSPLVNARLPMGHRVHAVIPPISPDGPHLTIRKFSKKAMSLEEMEQK